MIALCAFEFETFGAVAPVVDVTPTSALAWQPATISKIAAAKKIDCFVSMAETKSTSRAQSNEDDVAEERLQIEERRQDDLGGRAERDRRLHHAVRARLRRGVGELGRELVRE